MHRHGHHSKAQRGGRKITKYIIAVIVFLAFFGISNYYMGLFSSGGTPPAATRMYSLMFSSSYSFLSPHSILHFSAHYSLLFIAF